MLAAAAHRRDRPRLRRLLLAQDGSKFRVAYSSAPLAMRRRRGAVVVFRDVTSRIDDEHGGLPRNRGGARPRGRRCHASRARIVEAADAERRRLGRDLHDGAQQRLRGILLALRIRGRRRTLDTARLLDAARPGAPTRGASRSCASSAPASTCRILTNPRDRRRRRVASPPLSLLVESDILACLRTPEPRGRGATSSSPKA